MNTAPTPKPTSVPTKKPRVLRVTPSPEYTRKPSSTKSPAEEDATAAPKKTKPPKVTKEPAKTPKPTKKPEATKKPADSQVTDAPQPGLSDGDTTDASSEE